MIEEKPHEETEPKEPSRARRKWPRRLSLPTAASVLALAYHLTRPPELVWWRSSPVFGTVCVRCLVPTGWRLDMEKAEENLSGHRAPDFAFAFVYVDRRPRFLQAILQGNKEDGF